MSMTIGEYRRLQSKKKKSNLDEARLKKIGWEKDLYKPKAPKRKRRTNWRRLARLGRAGMGYNLKKYIK